ncbi:MAG: hypothetical protein Q9164_001466 [Protoblastenia rupestris]
MPRRRPELRTTSSGSPFHNFLDDIIPPGEGPPARNTRSARRHAIRADTADYDQSSDDEDHSSDENDESSDENDESSDDEDVFDEYEVPQSEDDDLEEGEIRQEEEDVIEISLEQFERNVDFIRRFPWYSAVNAYDRKLEQKPAEWYVENRDPEALELDYEVEEPPAIAFLNSLISLDIDELEDGDRGCSICTDPYFGGEVEEIPVRLPCDHVFGKHCLFLWMSQVGNATKTSCPACRTVHVERRAPLNTDTGLEQLLKQVDWMLTRMGPLRLDTEGYEKWQGVKEYVNEHLAEEKAKQRNERNLRRHIRREIGDSSIVRRLARLIPSTAEREELQNMLDAALLDWEVWRRPEEAEEHVMAEMIHEVEEEERQEDERARARENDDVDMNDIDLASEEEVES